MARQWRIEYPGAFYHLFSRGNGRQDILLDDDDRYAAYRRKIQRYANEEKRIWEDVKYGLAYGSQEFIDRLKKRFIKDGKDVELPQRNRLMRDMDPQQLAKRGAIAL